MQSESLLLWPPVVAFAVSVALGPLVIALARRLGILDQPAARKVHQYAIPRIGGLAIFGGLCFGSLTALLIGYQDQLASGRLVMDASLKQFLGLGLACTFICIVGFIDDVRSISSRFKLAALVFAAAVISGSGTSFGALNLGGQNYVEFRWLAWLATILWIVGITVAVNFIDGLDGLAAGLVAMSAAVLAMVLIPLGQYQLAAVSLALAGALGGFLVYNRHPAKIFMGDCGSMLIGICIASLMIFANPSVGTMKAIVLPSLALAVPILDGSLTFFRRHYLQRRSIFSAERGHIHHRLLDRGLRHHHAVWFLYIVSAAAVIIGFVAMAFDGLIATAAGLSLLFPLLWGAFRFAGSVRTTEMLRALRAKRDLDRLHKRNRDLLEAYQLEFEKFDSVGSWWTGLCRAAEDLDFQRVIVILDGALGDSDKTNRLEWKSSRADLHQANSIHAKIPVTDTPEHGGSARLEIDIAVTQSVELSGQRLALFSRLTTEHSLAAVRHRGRRHLAAARNRMRLANIDTSDDASSEAGEFSHLRVAVIHDFLYTNCGAERVLEQIINIVPHCDLFALFDFLPEDERGFLRGKPVTTSFIQRLPMAKAKHRTYLPLMPLAIEQLDVSGYDLIISSSYLAAKGVITGPDQLHVCYCHSPARYAWDLQHQYLADANLGYGPRGLIARTILHYLRHWDVRSSLGVDYFVANSQFVARRINKVYRRDAAVIHPPVDAKSFEVNTGERGDYYLVAGRMVPYKRTELIVEAFNAMPDRKLVIVGEGPDFEKVKALAGPNIELLGFQDNKRLVELMQRAKALVFAAEEDFGIVPVEALCCGTPVIAYGKGGVTESVIDGEHGVFFDTQASAAIIDAVARFESQRSFGKFDPQQLSHRGQSFASPRFIDQLTTALHGYLASDVGRDHSARLASPNSTYTTTSTTTKRPQPERTEEGAA